MEQSDKKREFIDAGMMARLSRLNLEVRSLMQGSFSGRHKSPSKGASVEFSEFRKYTPGDDINKIDWRVYARTDRYYIKEFEAETNLRCYILLDCSGSMQFEGKHGSKFRYAQKIVAALSRLLIEQGDAVGLVCFNNTVTHNIKPRTNARHLGSIYETLSTIQPEGQTQVVKTMHDFAATVQRRALVIIISDFFTELPPLMKSFQHMVHQKHDVIAFHLLDEEEVDFDFSQPLRFNCLESQDSILADPAILQDHYQKQFGSYLREFRTSCLQYDIDYRLIVTADSPEDLLASFLVERMENKK